MASLLNMSGGSLLKTVEGYLIFKDIDIWTVCCCNWGDYEEVVITDNGDNTVNIATTPVHMVNTTSTRGTTTTEYNVDNTGGTYTAGTTKVPVGIKRSQCLAVTGIKGGILKLANCKLYILTRSYDKAKEIYGTRFYRSDYRKADSPTAQFDIDADNYFRQNLFYMYFGYVNGSGSYVSYPNFGYDIDGDAVLDLFGQSFYTQINGIGYFNSFMGYHPTYFNKVRYSVISEDPETLPYDAQVEYLQSSGTQYIELPYKPNQDTSMEISASVAVGNGSVNNQFFEVRNAAWSREYALINFGDSNNKVQARYGNKSGGTWIKTGRMAEGTVYKIEYRKNDVYIDDVFAVTLTNYTFQGDYYLTLFGLNNGGSLTAAAGSPQIYYMKIYDGDTLALDLIPVRKGQVGYMYDKVSNQMLANAGTGDFILGNDVTT